MGSACLVLVALSPLEVPVMLSSVDAVTVVPSPLPASVSVVDANVGLDRASVRALGVRSLNRTTGSSHVLQL